MIPLPFYPGVKPAIRKPYLKLIAEGVKAVEARSVARGSAGSGRRLMTARQVPHPHEPAVEAAPPAG